MKSLKGLDSERGRSEAEAPIEVHLEGHQVALGDDLELMGTLLVGGWHVARWCPDYRAWLAPKAIRQVNGHQLP